MVIDKTYLKKELITCPTQLKVGNIIKVLKRPKTWSSYFSLEDPRFNLDFPCNIKIVKLENVGGYHDALLCDNNYGWSLDSIINAGCYKIN